MGIDDAASSTFLFIGDHGGIKHPNPQNAVSNAMQARAPRAPKPALVYTIGDIVHYNGDATIGRGLLPRWRTWLRQVPYAEGWIA